MKVKKKPTKFCVVHSEVTLSQSAIFHLQRGKAFQKEKDPQKRASVLKSKMLVGDRGH
jgi:hypothetical protein